MSRTHGANRWTAPAAAPDVFRTVRPRYPGWRGLCGVLGNGTLDPATLIQRRRRVVATLQVGLSVLVGGSLAALGAVYDWALIGSGTLALSLGLLTVLAPERGSVKPPLPAFVLMALAAYTALQCLPLPLEWLAVFTPKGAEIWSDAGRLVGNSITHAPVTLAPGASHRECVKWMSYAATFVVAARIAHSRGTHWVPQLVGATAASCTCIILAHAAFDASRYLGWYEPIEAGKPWALGPLMNPNNLSGYLNVGVFCLLGVSLSARAPLWRGMAILGAGTTLAVSVSYGSRAATAGVLVGLVVLTVLIAFGSGERWTYPARRGHRVGIIGMVALAGVVLVLALGRDALWSKLLRESTAKLRVLPWTWEMVGDFAWVGAGRGSFDTVFPAYARSEAHVRFQYAENFMAQWLSEWGVPISLVAAAALVSVYRRLLRVRELRAVELCSVLGLAVLFGQNLFDMALEVPGIGIMVSALLGSLWHASTLARNRLAEVDDGQHHVRTGIRSRLRRFAFDRVPLSAWRTAMASLFLAAIPMVFHIGKCAPLGDDARRHLHAALLAPDNDPVALLTRTASLVKAYPGDPYFPLVGAHLAATTGNGNGLKWVGQAIRRAPRSGYGYLALAKLLQAQGATAQALRMVAAAVQRSPGLTDVAARFALSVAPESPQLVDAAPSGAMGASFLVALANQPAVANDYELRFTLLQAAADRATGEQSKAATGELLRAIVMCVESGSPPCLGPARAAQMSRARALLARLKSKSRSSVTIPEAKLLLLEGKRAEAFHFLGHACGQTSDDVACHSLRLRLIPRGSGVRLVEAMADEFRQVACAGAAPCVEPLVEIAEVFSDHGLWSQAADALSEAATFSRSPALWVRVAEAANRSGDARLALSALRKAELLRR